MWQEPCGELKDFSQKSGMFRYLFKPATGSLWGFHKAVSSYENLLSYSKGDEELSESEEDANEVDLGKTLWLVLRKSKSMNQILKHFHADKQSFSLKVKDIVKFGRVNFKISALHSRKLNKHIQGSYNNSNSNPSHLQEKNLASQVSINVTDMQLLGDNYGPNSF